MDGVRGQERTPSLQVSEFLSEYPLPPRLQKGDRHQLPISISNSEYELIQKIAHSEKLPFDGVLSSVVRHALYWYMSEIADSLGPDAQLIIMRLRDRLIIENLVATKEAILELLDTIASKLNLLLDNNEIDGALEEYDKFLDFVGTLGATSVVVERWASTHLGLLRFKQRFVQSGSLRELDLQNVEEKPRG